MSQAPVVVWGVVGNDPLTLCNKIIGIQGHSVLVGRGRRRLLVSPVLGTPKPSHSDAFYQVLFFIPNFENFNADVSVWEFWAFLARNSLGIAEQL